MLAVQTDVTEVIVWASVVLAVFLVFGFGVLVYRRKYLASSPEQSEGFTLDDIRRMHRQGQLSDEEFEHMRRSLIGMAMRDTDE